MTEVFYRIVDMTMGEFPRKLKSVCEAFLLEGMSVKPARVERESWTLEIWLVRDLFERQYCREVTNHYYRQFPKLNEFRQFVKDLWPTYEIEFSACFVPYWKVLRLEHLPSHVCVEYTRLDVIITPA